MLVIDQIYIREGRAIDSFMGEYLTEGWNSLTLPEQDIVKKRLAATSLGAQPILLTTKAGNRVVIVNLKEGAKDEYDRNKNER